jgi:hypothetical protein
MRDKLTILAVFILVAVFGIAGVVFAQVTFLDETTIDLNTATDIIVRGGSEAEQLVVNAGDVEVTLDGAGGIFTVTSTVDLEVTGQSSTLSIDESWIKGNVTLLTLNPQGSDEVVTITPQTESCSYRGGAGGGGGGTAVTPPPSSPPAVGEFQMPQLPSNPTPEQIRGAIQVIQQQIVNLLQQLIEMLQGQLAQM